MDNNNNANVSSCSPISLVGVVHVNRKLPLEKPEAASTLCDKGLECKELTVGEMMVVMGKLGSGYDPDGDKLQDKVSSNEIAAIFQEQEPGIEEVQEAFCFFDENNDGFIDANELKKVISRLSLTEATESDCIRMIRAYDGNGDGVIDFDEFLGLLTDSLS